MHPETIGQIIKLSLELSLEIVRGIPLEQRQQWWTEHQARVDRLEATVTQWMKATP